mgnify:FL=1
MRVLTRDIQAKTAAERWFEQHFNSGRWYSADAARVYERLCTAKTADEVEAIIGNTSWTQPGDCAECEQDFPLLIAIGRAGAMVNREQNYCPACLRAALGMADAHKA